MKIINSMIGFIIIFVGCLFMTVSIEHEAFQSIMYNFLGVFIVVGGLHYLGKLANFRRQR